MLRLGLLIASAALLVGVVSARVMTQDSAAAHGIAGWYHCNGMDAAGNPYTGFVRIAERGSTVIVQWRFGAQSAGIGFGVLKGDSLAVSYLGPSPGVALYRLEGGQLVGTWTEPGAGGAVFSETLTPVADDEVPPGPAPPSEPRQLRERVHFGRAA